MQNTLTYTIKQIPFLRLIFPFILGIVFQMQFNINIQLLFYVFFILFIFFLFNIISRPFNQYKLRYIQGITINLSVFVSGMFLLKVNMPELFPVYEKKIIAEAVITEKPQEKANSIKTILQVLKYSSGNENIVCNVNIIGYFEKSTSAKQLKYGDKIIFTGNINEVRTQGNPYEFNYKKYLFKKGITGQTYIKADNFKSTDENKGSVIFAAAYRMRDKLASVFEKNSITGQEFAVLKALTLGDQSEIDTDTKKSYSYSGATHILSVSGLHVGIVYFLFNFFLKFLGKFKTKKFRYGIWIKVLIIIILLWGYALLSGLSPSVNRAALMFSFVVLGQAMNRYVNIYNSLAASAFLLLILNPFDLTDIGFQLSYIAVLSIVYFHPRITKLFKIKNRILFYFWSLTSVSIAAQIGTFPIAMYYFNMFPNYFIITNIIVIPLSTIIIYLAVFMLFFSFIPVFNSYIGIILKYAVSLLNDSVKFIEAIPFSFTEHIPFNFIDVLFSYVLILLISVYLSHKYFRFYKSFLIIVVLWLSISTAEKIYFNNKNEILVFNISGETAISFVGMNNYLIADQSIFTENKLKYGALPYWLHKGKTDYCYIDVDSLSFHNDEILIENNYILFFNKKILIINTEKQLNYITDKPINIDLMIISRNVKTDMSEIRRLYHAEKVIFDASNKYYYTKDRMEECEKLSLNCYSVEESGAFRMKF